MGIKRAIKRIEARKSSLQWADAQWNDALDEALQILREEDAATPKPRNAKPEDLAPYDSYFDECERANTHPLCFDAWLKAGKPEHPRGTTYETE